MEFNVTPSDIIGAQVAVSSKKTRTYRGGHKPFDPRAKLFMAELLSSRVKQGVGTAYPVEMLENEIENMSPGKEVRVSVSSKRNGQRVFEWRNIDLSSRNNTFTLVAYTHSRKRRGRGVCVFEMTRDKLVNILRNVVCDENVPPSSVGTDDDDRSYSLTVTENGFAWNYISVHRK